MSRAVGLIAAHELLETIKSKSFLISLVLIPLLFAFGIMIPQWLERQTATTRTVIVVDAAGGFADAFERELDRAYARRVMDAVNQHLRAFAYPEFRTPRGLDATALPLILLKGREELTDGDADRFLAQGGLDWYLTIARPFLAPDSPPPVVPPPAARAVPLPDAFSVAQVLASPAETLRPWLKGSRKLNTGDGERAVTAAVVFPPNVEPAEPDSLAAMERGTAEESVQIWSEGALPDALARRLANALDELFRERALLAAGGNPRILEAQDAQAPLLELDISAPEGREVTPADVVERILPRALSVLLIYFLYINMFMLMSNTMEEKSSRIIEVLVSTVRPVHLMIGKLLGSSLVALTMFAVSVGSLIAVFMFAGGSATVEFAGILIDIVSDSPILLALFGYFLLGYFLFAGIFLTLGAFCETRRDVQNLGTPMALFMIMVPIIVWAFAEEPNSGAATALSFAPFFGPFMLMARVTAEPPLLEVAGAVAVQLLSIVVLLWGSGKIFRVAVLFSGKPPKIGQLLRIVRREE